MATFPAWLQEQLQARQMTPAALARASGKSQAVIGRILKGERRAAPETIVAIAAALELPVETVLLQSYGIEPTYDPTTASPSLLEWVKVWQDAPQSAHPSMLAVARTLATQPAAPSAPEQ